jgi:hypothetical protein
MRHYSPKQSWKRLLFETRKNLIREEGEKNPFQERGNDSVDIQIDKFFSSFESESKSSKNEGLDWRRVTRRLLEAEDDEEANLFGGGDDEEEGGDEEEPADDEEAGDEEGEEGDEEEEEPEEPEKLTLEDIDINAFASSVARLVDNYDSLLELRDTITRRAMNFLGKNYDFEVSQKFKQIMSDQFDLGADQTPNGLPDEKFQAPHASRALGGGGGGGGV